MTNPFKRKRDETIAEMFARHHEQWRLLCAGYCAVLTVIGACAVMWTLRHRPFDWILTPGAVVLTVFGAWAARYIWTDRK